jgi:polyisoprenyl-phosphate glycosyltransferase
MTHFVLSRCSIPTADRPTPKLSVVVPAFNAQELPAETHRRLRAACVAAVGSDFKIVYVDDGSRDRNWSMLSALASSDNNVVAVGLSSNFGHQRGA